MSKVFLGIGALTMLASGALAIGLAANPKDVVEAEASTLTNKVILQLNTADWKSSSSKIALYFFDNSQPANNAWGGFVTPDGTSTYVDYPYSLNFTPTGCIAFRFSPSVETCGQWCFDDNRSNPAIWSTTNDITFKDVIYLDRYTGGIWTESGSYTLDTYIRGGASDDWSVATVDTQLTSVKVNQSGHLEVYGSATLPAGTYFKAYAEADSGNETTHGYYGSYSAYTSIASNLTGGGDSNIHNTAQATYEFYFDFNDKTLYITDPIVSAADEWGQYFTAHAGCDKVGNATPTGWSTVATEYAKLDGAVKNYIYALDHKKGGTYIEDALFDYDWAISRNGDLEKFVKDADNHVRTSHIAITNTPAILGNVNNSAVIATVVIVSLVAVTTIGGIIILKRKER